MSCATQERDTLCKFFENITLEVSSIRKAEKEIIYQFSLIFSRCEFSKAHCADTTIDLKHYGACNATDGSTSTSGAEEVLDFFCTHLSHMDCATGGTKVCGSDGRMYDN